MRPWAPLFLPVDLTAKTLDRMLALLVAENEDWLREHPETPDLYASGIRYVAERPGKELFLAIPWCLLQRVKPWLPVDCEDLCAWRVAELHIRGREPKARCISTPHLDQGRILWHVQVRRQNSRIEDPSALLGMR